MGGRSENPTYEQVCIGNTGHAEVVQVVYRPDQISYAALLDQFWKIHDPTARPGSSLQMASQYRSVIFYHSVAQAALAQAAKVRAQADHHNAIATQVLPAGSYTRAEAFHQQYEEKQARRRQA
ncbi:MAG: peptide-methionine (S)-S-oxide reductase MsrA [Rhodospirillales bacterium]|nr:peptide-methionine (S)-S-oxide reductase MsrA [Rhodospirillales bacterium]